MKQRGKNNWSPIPIVLSLQRVLLNSKRTLDLWYSVKSAPTYGAKQSWSFATHLNRALYCILRPVSMGHYAVFASKMASMALWYSVKSAPTYRAQQSWSFATRLNGRYTVFCDPSQLGTLLYLLLKWPLWPSDTQWNLHQHTEPSSLDLLRPVSTGRYTVFCDPSQWGAIQYLLLKWHWAFATHLYIYCDTLALWPSGILCAWGFPLDASHRQLYLYVCNIVGSALLKP